MSKHVCRHVFESRPEHGFSLIELMIVMSIISILSSISIPHYVNYAVRARWSDNIVQVALLKNAIAECAQFNNNTINATTCNDVAFLIANAFLPLGYVLPGPSVAGGSAPYMATSVTVGSAAPAEIVITGTVNTALGCVVTLTPTLTASTVTWNYSMGAQQVVAVSERASGLSPRRRLRRAMPVAPRPQGCCLAHGDDPLSQLGKC